MKNGWQVVAHAFHSTGGVLIDLKDVINDAIFAENHDEMVLVREIDISSLCEHHLVPFTGKVRQLCSGLRVFLNSINSGRHCIHPKPTCSRHLQIGPHCRNFQPSAAGAGTTD
jgi:hypothetical protein